MWYSKQNKIDSYRLQTHRADQWKLLDLLANTWSAKFVDKPKIQWKNIYLPFYDNNICRNLVTIQSRCKPYKVKQTAPEKKKEKRKKKSSRNELFFDKVKGFVTQNISLMRPRLNDELLFHSVVYTSFDA